MALVATIPVQWHRLKQQWYAWRAHLHRQRAVVALLLMLVLPLTEPLLCIIHCDIWLPLAFHGYVTSLHDYHIHNMVHGAAVPTRAVDTVGVFDSLSTTTPPCFMISGLGDGVPLLFYWLRSLAHDILSPVLCVFLIILVFYSRVLAPPGDPPSMTIPPLLRPPIINAS